ncbi:MAG: hypothetical protein CO094_02495 [Anaerolineae bacterium CG_4_9_14_3_um_filter_57_17]|nr:MAG: hypothetical protein CO094_02495 [Anaerolineae bacterium CG_4_9_14_3_um_filter_57_17]
MIGGSTSKWTAYRANSRRAVLTRVGGTSRTQALPGSWRALGARANTRVFPEPTPIAPTTLPRRRNDESASRW